MDILHQSAFLKALGWSLLDSFWQMGIMWLLYVLLTRNGKKFQSGQRHSLALLSLAGGCLWFVITLVFHYNHLAGTKSVTTFGNIGGAGESATLFFSVLEPLFPFLSVAYLVAIAYLFIRLYRQYYVTQRLYTSGLFKVNPELRVFLQQISGRMGIKKDVRIWISELVDTPLTIGFWKPVILLPVAAINHLSIPQAEAIILHELNHIRRNDYLINLLIACMDILLFFNPFVRILTHIIKNERENSCDDMVLQFSYNASQYANALLLLEKNRMHTPALTIAATGKNKKLLLNRVERILNKKTVSAPVNQRLIAYFLSALLIGFIGWYNPGKVIIKTMDTVQNATMLTNTEQQIVFKLPVSTSRETVGKIQSVENKKSIHPAHLPSQQNDEQESSLASVVEWVAEEEAVEPAFSPMASATPSDPLTPLTAYVSVDPETREYSIPENVVTVPAYTAEPHPYIPSTSFSYHALEDTALPKKYILKQSEIKAREAMNTALKALQEIDWQKLEKELNAAGKKVDIVKLQHQLKSAMADVDWKKINEEVNSSFADAQEELLQEHAALQSELQKFQRDRALKQAQHAKIYKTIINDRLCEQDKETIKENRKKQVIKKKVVII